MVAERQLNDDGTGEYQSIFSHHSMTNQSDEWQARLSDLSVIFLLLKNKIKPEAARIMGCKRIKGKIG